LKGVDFGVNARQDRLEILESSTVKSAVSIYANWYITAVTAAAIEHALAGTWYRARIKGASTGHPCPAFSDAAVYAAAVSGGSIRFYLRIFSFHRYRNPSQTFFLAVRL
jgi:hypothetical protein